MISSRRAKRQAKQLFRLCVTGDMLDEDRARQLARGITGSGYRSSGPVFASFLRLVRLYRAQHSAVIASATPVPPDLRAAIETGLGRQYGPALTVAFACEPALIGGMRIQVGSDVYDGSVRGALETLEQRL